MADEQEEKKLLKATPKEFEQLCRGEKVILSMEGGIEYCCLVRDRVEGEKILIEELIVEETIELTGEYQHSIYVTGHTNLQSLAINGQAQIEGFIISGEAQTGHFIISGETETQYFKISGEAQTRDFKIFGEAQIEFFSIFSKAQTGGFRISGAAQIRRFSISGVAQTAYFNISGEAQAEDFHIYGAAQIGGFSISGAAQTGDFNISGEAQAGNFHIYEVTQIGEVSISGAAHTGYFDIFGEAQTGNFSVYEAAQTGVFSISGAAQTGVFVISGAAQTGQVIISENSRMKGLRVNGAVVVGPLRFEGGEIIGTPKFSNLNMQILEITGSETEFPNEFRIQNGNINRLHFIDFGGFTNLKITNLRSEKNEDNGLIEFRRSSFQKLELIGNDFQGYDFIAFENSDITSAFIADTSFPDVVKKPIEIINKGAESEGDEKKVFYKEDDRQAKLFFEQLKTVFQKQGNRTEALTYQSKELNAQYKLISLWDSATTLDKTTLWFGKWSSNFGTSWIRGLGFFGVTSVILFFLLMISTRGVRLIWPWKMTWTDFNYFAGHYFEFINPTSYIWKKWDLLETLEGGTGEVRWGLKALLLFSKVWMVAIIYQIVQAFRKFGRR